LRTRHGHSVLNYPALTKPLPRLPLSMCCQGLAARSAGPPARRTRKGHIGPAAGWHGRFVVKCQESYRSRGISEQDSQARIAGGRPSYWRTRPRQTTRALAGAMVRRPKSYWQRFGHEKTGRLQSARADLVAKAVPVLPYRGPRSPGTNFSVLTVDPADAPN